MKNICVLTIIALLAFITQDTVIPHELIQARKIEHNVNQLSNPQTSNQTLQKTTNNVNYLAMVGMSDYGWRVGPIIGLILSINQKSRTSITVSIWFQNTTSMIFFSYSFLIVQSEFWQTIPSFWIEKTEQLKQENQRANFILPYTKPNSRITNFNGLTTLVCINMFYSNSGYGFQGSDIYNYAVQAVDYDSFKIIYYTQAGTVNKSVGFNIIFFADQELAFNNANIGFEDKIAYSYTNTNQQQSFNIDPNLSNNIFFTVSQFVLGNVGYGAELYWRFTQQNSTTLTVQAGVENDSNGIFTNTMYTLLISFSRLECPDSLVYSPITNQCLNCPQHYAYNESSYRCQTCPQSCQNCSIIGQAYYCFQCIQNFYLSIMHTCCKPLFACTNFVCFDGQDTKCLQCEESKHAEISQSECKCIKGYQYNSQNQSCQSVCNDGIKLDDQQCDDGNTQNGDGCSNTCFIEAGFTCKSIQQTTSKCLFTDKIQLEYVSAKKSYTENVATLQFSLKPNLNWLNEAEIQNIAIVPTIFHDFEIKREQNRIILIGPFNQTMEDNSFQLLLNIKSELLQDSRSNLSVKFVAIGKVVPIIFVEEQTGNNFQIMKYIIYVILGNLVILLVLSVLTHRMVGPEAIISLQASYLLQIITSKLNMTNSLQLLKYINGPVALLIINEESTFHKSLVYLGFQSHYAINNTLLAAIIVLVSSVIIIIYKLRLLSLKKILKNIALQENCNYNQSQINLLFDNFTTLQFQYYSVLFRVLQPFCLSFMLIYIWSVQLNLIFRTFQMPQMGFLHLLNLIICSFGYFIMLFMVWLQLLAQKAVFLKTPQVKMKHFPTFLLWKANLVVLVLGFYIDFPMLAKYVALIIEVCYVFYLIGMKPYANCFHNVSLFINELPLLLIIGLSFYADSEPEIQNEWLILFQFIYIGLFLLIIVCSYIRITIHWCSGKEYKLIFNRKKRKNKNKNDKSQNSEQKSVSKQKVENQPKENPYLLQNQLHHERVQQINQINKTRQKQGFTQLTPPKRPTHPLEHSSLRKATQADKKQLKKLKNKLTKKPN